MNGNEEHPTGLGRFLTVAETAETLTLSAPQVMALIASGELPAIQVGEEGRWRVERRVLETYIEALYEESRRSQLWHQSEFANITDLWPR